MRKTDGTVLGGLTWSRIKLGGLGFAAKGRIAADGSWMMIGCDVSGAYRRDSTSEAWAGCIPTTSKFTQSLGGDAPGVYEIDIAPSNANIALMAFRSKMWRSTDKGVTWANDSLNGTTGLYMSPNVDNSRRTQWKLRFDPSNAAVAYLGTQQNGLWQRLTAGWSQIASVTAPTYGTFGESESSIIIAVDPSSALTTAGADQRRSIVYVSSAGNGVYKSTDGGTTFTLLANTPTIGASYKAYHMVCGPTGALHLCVNNGADQNIYTTSNGGTSWVRNTATPAGNGITCLEIDPKDATRWVACANGKPLISTNSGVAWTGPYQPTTQTAKATAAPLAANAHESTYRRSSSIATCIFPHPVLNRDYMWSGWGVMWTASPWATSLAALSQVWYEDVKGTEQLVAYSAMIHPDGTTFLSVHDRGIIKQNSDRSKYATKMFPYDAAIGLTWGCNSDYAINDTNFIVARNFEFSYDSCKSTDKGDTWTRLSTSTAGKSGGMIIVANKNQIAEFFGQNGWPKYSADEGVTWNYCTFSGFTRIVDGTVNGFQWGDYLFNRRFIACVDKSTGYMYCFNYGPPGATTQVGVWRSTDGGANWVKRGSPTFVGGQDMIWNANLICAPGGHLFLHAGQVGSDLITENANNPAYRSEDGGVTWVQVGQINEPYMIAAGAPKPGSSIGYALYAHAFKSGVFGLYRSDDKGVTWVAINDNTTHYDDPLCLAADPAEFGRVVVGYSGTGFFEGRYNYNLLLKGS